MPNCFQLLRDGAAVPLADVDAEICLHFDVPCSPTSYYEFWYDAIGYSLAQGRTFDEIRATYADSPRLVEIANWIEARFTVRSWYEQKGFAR
jgi:polysaccharide deacetylase 2 family uncharacterized protein YibQ